MDWPSLFIHYSLTLYFRLYKYRQFKKHIPYMCSYLHIIMYHIKTDKEEEDKDNV